MRLTHGHDFSTIRGMKDVIKEILRTFYESGVPDEVIARDVEYYEKPTLATVIKGMRRAVRFAGGQAGQSGQALRD